MKDTYVDSKGYERFKNTDTLVHRYIAKKYIYLPNKDKYPLPFNKYQVHHKDGVTTHNHSDNLELLEMEDHWNSHFPKFDKFKTQFLKFKKTIIISLCIVILLIALLVIVITKQNSREYTCAYDTYNCGDFKTHAEAQRVFEECGGVNKDVHQLDGDKDGLACEILP